METPALWLRKQAAPVRSLLTRGAVAGTIQALAMCGGAWLVAHVLAQAIFAKASLLALWPALAGIVAIAGLRAWLTVRQRMLAFDAGDRIVRQVHASLGQRLRARGPDWANRQSSGDLVTRLVDGVDALAPYYSGYLPQMCLAAIIPAVVLVWVLAAEPWSALVLLGCAPLLPVFMVLVGKAAAQASERRWMRLRRLGARFMDALSGLTTLRLYGAATREQRLLAAAGDDYRRETMGVLRIAFLSALVLEFFATVSIAVIAVMIGFRLLGGTLGFEAGMFALILAPEFFGPLRSLGTQRHQRMEATAAAEGLLAVLAGNDAAGADTAPVNVDAEVRAGADIDAEAAHVARSGPADRRAPAIVFEDVAFGHDDDRDILDALALTVPAGSRLTLVGESGAGKSSVLNLLMGFATPRRGRILVDGVDLGDLPAATWRERIAWVSQRPHVFHGSVRDNLLIARPGADELTLWRAIQFAALTPVISRLPQGLETLLGEHGAGLSGGEFQRLAIARAWLRDAPVLLLDEPTQHLDATTAQRLDQALDAFGQGRTVIRVAHRLQTIADDEPIAVMSHGRLVERGLAGELRAHDGVYAALIAAERSA